MAQPITFDETEKMTWVLKVSLDSLFGEFSSDNDLLQKNENNFTLMIQIKTT
jgi:hypothetical protein